MNNLHIVMNEFRHESRILKETSSLISARTFENIYIAALHVAGLDTNKKISQGISLKRIPLRSRSLGKSAVPQLLKYLEYSVKLFFFAKKKKIAAINIHSLALLPIGYLLKVAFKAKLIYDTHELETETNGLSGIRKKASKIIEKFFIKKVDQIFVVSENIADWYENEYQIPRPVVVFNAPTLQKLERHDHFRNIFSIRKDQTIFLYQGGLVKGRNIEKILKAFQTRVNDKAVVVFMGYGEFEEKIKNAATSTNNIYFHPAVSPDQLLQFTASADIGISYIENTSLSYYFCMPNKLFEYAMMGLPVLVSNMKEMRETVEAYRMGIVIEKDDLDSLRSSIDRILSADLHQMRKTSREAAEKNCWEKQEIKMLSAYRQLFFK